MSYPQALVIPVSRGTVNGEAALVQDITNGQVAELMTDAELALAVLGIAGDQPAFHMTYALLDEAARRLSPQAFGLDAPAQPVEASRCTLICHWAVGACVGALIALTAVYFFFVYATSAIH